jgi:hypothetical protein
MKVIHRIVCGESMEILQFLLSFFSDQNNFDKFSGLINAFKENSFDLNSVIKNIDLKTILPILKELFLGLQNKSPTEIVGQGEGLTPIANIADKNIVFVLNKYLGQP